MPTTALKRTADLANNQVVLRFSFDRKIISEIKKVPGARWDPVAKVWRLPLTAKAEEVIGRYDFAVTGRLAPALPGREAVPPLTEEIRPAVDLKIPGLKAELLNYQKAGVKFALEKKRVLIADEPGLGKTLQTLAFLQARKDLRPSLIVCPASLKLNWRAEIGKFLENCPENRAEILEGERPYAVDAPIVIVNYDILHAWAPTLKSKAFVLDESHLIKNRAARRTKAAQEAAKGAEAVLCLTGTPVLNRPMDLFTQLNLLAPEEFPDYFRFGLRYCNGCRKKVGVDRYVWDFTGASRLEELNRRLRETVMIRRLKKDVLRELPPKRLATVPVELASPKEYLIAEQNFLRWLSEWIKRGKYEKGRLNKAARAEALVKVGYLQYCAARLKIKSVLEWVAGFLESGEKLILFAHHQAVIDYLAKQFKNCVVLRGGQDARAKREAETKFQSDPRCQLLIGSLGAAGVGLNLTAASNVALIEFPWRPADLDQAVDRAHRIGQLDSVTAWLLAACAPGIKTVDERILGLLEKKRGIADQALDGKGKGGADVLGELLDGYLG